VQAVSTRRAMPTALGGRYRLRERLGSGGSADVYRAHDERLDRDVAVKIIAEWLATDEATVRRFQREAELAARLAHPNIPAILDVGSHPRPYIVMELVEGLDAATLLNQNQPLAASRAVDLIVQVCDALEHTHDRGVIHCDVAPRNLLIGEQDGAAKLIDFGLALDRFAAEHPGDIMGTPGYVAPEIVGGRAPSPHSDVYSLGVVAYRLLGGPPPFRRTRPEQTVARPSAVADLPPLGEVQSDVPPAVTAIVGSAMAQLPAARPSIAELRDRLLDTRAGAITLRAA
jgi:serine/threonine protein kinase